MTQAIAVDVSVRLDMERVSQMQPDQIKAPFEGLAKILGKPSEIVASESERLMDCTLKALE